MKRESVLSQPGNSQLASQNAYLYLIYLLKMEIFQSSIQDTVSLPEGN